MSQPDLELAIRTLAASAGGSKPLPDADMVWQRAAARERWRQYELATRSVRVAELATCIVCVVTGVVALFALRPGVEAALRAMDQTVVGLAGLALASTAAIALFLIKALWAED
jgi:hypothetical protein